MKRLILTTLSVCLFFSFLTAQTENNKSAKNKAFYFELGGSGLLYSINIEQSLRIDRHSKLALGIGTEYLTDLSVNNQTFHHALCFIPAANLLFGSKSHHIEVGAAFITVINKGGFIPSTRIGYRYQPSKGGLLFRVGFTPIYDFGFRLRGGISIGYAI